MKKNIPLIVGIALPIVFIIIISLSIYIPTLYVNPEHNFIYSMNDNYYSNNSYKNTYKITDGKIHTEQTLTAKNNGMIDSKTAIIYMGENPPLYLYDVKTNSSHEITLEEAEKYNLDPGPSSPDGYNIDYGYNNNGIFELFGSSRNGNGFYVYKGNSKKMLTGLSNSKSYYYGAGYFNLIGWVK